ncbi:MAG: T9SS type A sorting domain-containing protein, partial [Taibaiella sp.]|nr:T9SS type A sorting domain-containing protein [Taibaiella sp.]
PLKPAAGSNSPLCAGNALLFTLTDTTAGVIYSWTGPGNFTSSAKTPQITNTSTTHSGDYIITANLNGCVKADTVTILVNPIPDTVTLSANTPVCAGDTLRLSSDTSTTGVAYLWNGPLSYTASTQNAWIANAPVAATGWYKMTVSLNGCSYADSIYAVVNSVPSAPSLSYNSPLCISETLQLAATTQAGAGYSWSGPGNFTSTQQNPTRNNMQFADTGMYKVIKTVNGCSSSESSIGVYINPVPFVVILANPADSICQGDAVVFTAYANNHGGTPSYQWYVNAQAAGTGQIFTTTSLNNQDVVRCDMTENTKCSAPYTDESNDITLQVLPWLAPSVSITANPNRPLNKDEYITFTALPVNAGIIPLYQWKRNGQDIIGATGSVWSANTLNDNDSISVELVSSYQCPQPTTALSNGIIVKVLSSVGDNRATNDIQLYPNPNNGSFIISGRAHSTQVARVQVVNAVGRVVYEDTVITKVGKLYHPIELGNTAAGIYILKVSTDAGSMIIRFVKQ